MSNHQHVWVIDAPDCNEVICETEADADRYVGMLLDSPDPLNQRLGASLSIQRRCLLNTSDMDEMEVGMEMNE